MLQQNVNSIKSISMKAIMDMKYHKAGNPEEESQINMVKEMIRLNEENYNWKILTTLKLINFWTAYAPHW